jgi:zinc protease
VQRQPSETFTLANGLQVVVLPSRRAPIVTQVLVYKVGSADETFGQTGVAHFLEHMMFKGTAMLGRPSSRARWRATAGATTPSPASTSTGYSPDLAPTGSSW